MLNTTRFTTFVKHFVNLLFVRHNINKYYNVLWRKNNIIYIYGEGKILLRF